MLRTKYATSSLFLMHFHKHISCLYLDTTFTSSLSLFTSAFLFPISVTTYNFWLTNTGRLGEILLCLGLKLYEFHGRQQRCLLLSKMMWWFKRSLTFQSDLTTLAYQGRASYCLHNSTEDLLGQTEERGSAVYYCFISVILGKEGKKKGKTLHTGTPLCLNCWKPQKHRFKKKRKFPSCCLKTFAKKPKP